MLVRELQGAGVAGGERGVFAMAAAVPDRADGVDHMARGQTVAAGNLGIAGFAAAERFTLGEQLRTGCTMDRAIDAAAAKQRRIGGVDDRVDGQRGDVGDDDLTGRRADLAGEVAQAAALMPLSVNSFCSSPAWNISRTISQPPTNSPFTYSCGMVGQFE